MKSFFLNFLYVNVVNKAKHTHPLNGEWRWWNGEKITPETNLNLEFYEETK